MLTIYVECPNEVRIRYGITKEAVSAWGYFRTQRFLEGLQSGVKESRLIVTPGYSNGEEINEVYINDVLVFKEGKVIKCNI